MKSITACRPPDRSEAATRLPSTPITEPLAQDYAAWRFAVLCLAAVVLVIGALVQLGNFETVSGGMVREAVIAEQQRGNFVDEDIVRQRVEANFGVDNLDLLDLIPIISLLAVSGNRASQSQIAVRKQVRFLVQIGPGNALVAGPRICREEQTFAIVDPRIDRVLLGLQ